MSIPSTVLALSGRGYAQLRLYGVLRSFVNVTAGRAVYKNADRLEASGWGVATLIREIIAMDVKSPRREGERLDETDALFTGADRGGGVGGMRAGLVGDLGEGGGHLPRQERHDGLHPHERRRDPLLAARTRRGSQDRSRRGPPTFLLARRQRGRPHGVRRRVRP